MDRELIKNTLDNAGFHSVQSETLSHIFAQMATKSDIKLLEERLLRAISESSKEAQEKMTKMMVGLIIALATIFTMLDIFID